MSTRPKTFVTPEEYLERERKVEYKSEYYNGEEPRYADTHLDTLVNPALIVEILSPGTEGYDRGRKARLYRSMPSLRELLLIAQDQYEVELHRRGEDGIWMLLNAVGLDASIELISIGCTLRLGELYENIPEE